MTADELKTRLEQGYNRVPLMREVLADLDTPLSTYLKLADGPYSYLFESVQGGESGAVIRSSACRRAPS